MGAAGTINDLGNLIVILYIFFIQDLLSFADNLYFWFRAVIREHIAGLDSAQLQKSFVFGMGWFIFSEVMFFAAFFGALFYVRNFSVPWLGGDGEKGLANMLWEGFESSWPVMSTPDAGSAFVLADKNMSWPGWGNALKWLPMWNTIVLLSSSVTVHFAHLALKNNNKKSFNVWLGITCYPCVDICWLASRRIL
jgi:cytochrome c oxidase subunit 3